MKFTNRKGKLRLYDGSATPFYLELNFDNGDFSGPLGVPKTEEVLVLNRGVMDAHAHYIEGGDDKVMEPFDISFSCIVEDTSITTNLLDWLEGGPIGPNTLVTTKGTTMRDGANTNPAFADSSKKCSNVEYMLDGANDLVWHYNEIYFDLSETTISESADGVTVSLKGKCYGTVVRDSAFTAGTDVTA